MAKQSSAERRRRRHWRIRTHVRGSAERPRLAIYRSNKFIYAQLIDDDAQRTLCAASTIQKALREGLSGGASNAAAASTLGRVIAERAKEKGVTKVCFDRGGYKYHGRIKAVADAAREAGLEF